MSGSERVAGVSLPAPRVEAIAADEDLVRRLRAGDERTFAGLVVGWSPIMLRVARFHVSTDASAEEVVQETWMAVVRGIDAFESRATVRTWAFRILTNLAKTRGVREARTVPLSALSRAEGDEGDLGPTVDPDRFTAPGQEWSGHWTTGGAPTRWPSPERAALSAEIRAEVAGALARIPQRQRLVVMLRDVHGLDSTEVCAALGISAANQRVLLHRGRAAVRASLEDYYRGAEVL